MSGGHKAQVQAQFGASAHDYVTSPGHAGGADLDRLVGWGRRRGASRVLDVATGGGHTALAFSAFTPAVIATDLTLPMLAAARQFIEKSAAHPVRFAASDVEALPFRNASFGVVTCRLAAHHFPALLPALREVARVLRPGGTFLVQDILGHDDPELSAFILEVEKRRDPSHVRSLTHREWEAFLKAAGMTVMDELTMTKSRPWEEWTARMRMSPAAKADLEGFVLTAPPRCREAFSFTVADGRIQTFSDRLILLRADRD
ncbi:MAG TPA: class I SAM-dependent methyltransferase [Candidatus Bathyarchaeia archaeon]|nr:class I SAM-dependent methyltransferase [Candidatus Bathyarchaeia archaeon]